MVDMDGGDDEVVSYPPWNFSWVVPGELAAMGFPRCDANLQFLVEQGVNHLVTLSPEKIPNVYRFPELKWTEVAVDEFEAPSLQQMKKFIEICQRSNLSKEVVGIHCRQGRGRTGVMAAIFLVHFYDQSPERAVINVRHMRPGSLETPEQERAVIKYHDCLRGLK